MKPVAWQGSVLLAVMALSLCAGVALVHLAEPGNVVYDATDYRAEPVRVAFEELAGHLAGP